MRSILLLILFNVLSGSIFCQAWVWEKAINTTNNSIATDPNNNIIVLAKNGAATQLSKFSKDGLLIWSNTLTKSAAFTPSGSVVTDTHGNIYIFTEGFDSINHQFSGLRPQGITKFDPNGNVLWHNYYSVGSGNIKLSMQIDENENVYVGFSQFGIGNVTITLGTTTTITSAENYFLSIGSISSSGTVRWLRGFKFKQVGGSLAVATSMTLANNILYVGGYSGKYQLILDNGLVLANDRCTAWLAAFDANDGQSKWGKTHNLIYFCAGILCACSNPSVMASPLTGKVALTNNLNGAFVFQPLDTIASIMNFGLPAVKSYYTIYDTLGTAVKGKIIEDVPDQFSYNENLTGSRNNFFFVQYRDTLRKVDTGFNLLWRLTLPASTGKIFVPQSGNDLITTYTKAGVIYLAKMVDSAGVISGRAYADWDNNNIYTGADTALNNILITSNTAASSISGNDSGKYYMYAAPGVYSLTAHFNHPYYEFLPSTNSAVISHYSDSITGKDFRLRPLFAFTDVSVTMSPVNTARPGRLAYYNVAAKNFGAAVQPVEVGLKLPALTSYNSIISNGTVTVNAPDSITIALGNINPFETKKAVLYLNVSTTATLNDTLKYYPVAYPYTPDTIKANNRDTLIQAIRNSFDPNEKTVNHTAQPLADMGKALQYTIHFQNTGNDTAFYVRIADTLSPKLDLSTFNFIDASHLVTTEIKNNIINFIFNPVALPDSGHNEPLSNGFVKFSIKPLTPFNIADTIFNNAAIYFDYNNAVITNIAKSWFFPVSPLPVILKSFVADNKKSSIELQFVTATEADLNYFIIERSNDGVTYNPIGTVNSKGNTSTGSSYIFEDLAPGNPVNFYRLKMVDKDGKVAYSWILVVKFSNKEAQQISIFPNPANHDLYINFKDITTLKTFNCSIADAAGKTVWAAPVNSGRSSTYTINTARFPDGIYFFNASNNTIIFHTKFAVKH